MDTESQFQSRSMPWGIQSELWILSSEMRAVVCRIQQGPVGQVGLFDPVAQVGLFDPIAPGPQSPLFDLVAPLGFDYSSDNHKLK